MNLKPLLLCIWCGPVATVLFFLGFMVLAHFIPPPSPTLSAEVVAELYRTNTNQLRIGMMLTMISMSMILPWGIAIAAVTRRTEGDIPVLAYTQMASCAVGTLIIILFPVVFLVATFRPGEFVPEIVSAFHDLGWFLLLLPWPPFTIWAVAMALAIFGDKGEPPALPRWTGYLSLWAGFLFIPAGMIVFFKTGPFAWNGLIAFYVPVAAFFVWIMATFVEVRKTIRRCSGYQ